MRVIRSDQDPAIKLFKKKTGFDQNTRIRLDPDPIKTLKYISRKLQLISRYIYNAYIYIYLYIKSFITFLITIYSHSKSINSLKLDRPPYYWSQPPPPP